MASFVLVHGAFHGGWCWDRVADHLRRRGHHVNAPTLAQSDDVIERDADDWLTLWREQLVGIVDRMAERPILVGHSRGGIVTSAVAEARPDRLTGLVYLAAMLVGNGETMADARERLGHDASSAVSIQRSADGRSVIADPVSVEKSIYHGASPADRSQALSMLTSEPRATFAIKAAWSPGNFGRVPRAYIECLDDRAIPIEQQRAMQIALPCDPVIALATDHAPFTSAPAALADALEVVAERFVRPSAQAGTTAFFHDSVDAPFRRA